MAGVMENCISHCMEILYDLWWLFGARYKDSNSLSLKAVEMEKFVSYFSNFTRECFGSVICALHVLDVDLNQ
jgi:hypothetical protein